MKIHRHRIALAFLASTVFAGATAAADEAKHFNITVPVSVSNLPPNIARMHITCYVYGTGGSWGVGRTSVDIAARAYSGDVTLRFDADAGRDPAGATHYECLGWFTGTEAGATVHYFLNATAPRFPLAAGAAFRLTTGRTALPR